MNLYSFLNKINDMYENIENNEYIKNTIVVISIA